VLADISIYNVGLFLHIAAVVVVFGATYCYPFMFAVAAKSGLEATVSALRVTTVVERYLITPGSIFILLVGFYLVGKGDWSGSDAFVVVGVVAIVALLGMSHAFFKPHTNKAIEYAERDLAAGGPPSAELQAEAALLQRGGQLAGLIVMVTIFFMVVKP
jgi:uncharacterized membrane protein